MKVTASGLRLEVPWNIADTSDRKFAGWAKPFPRDRVGLCVWLRQTVPVAMPIVSIGLVGSYRPSEHAIRPPEWMR